MRYKPNIARPEHIAHKSPSSAWIEIVLNSENIPASGTFDEDAILVQIKYELRDSHKKTLEWQRMAMLDSFPTD
jgi:hypothetical protein